MFFDFYRGQQINLGVTTVQHYRCLQWVANTVHAMYSATVGKVFLQSDNVEDLKCQIDRAVCC